MTTINYFISENYIPHWTLEDAYREIFQNFVDYGDYKVIIDSDDVKDYVTITNTFNPESADLLIIGESNKSENQIGKYGEGLKMAALVLLRMGYSMEVSCKMFEAKFILVENTNTTVKTLGVEITDGEPSNTEDFFDVQITAPIGDFKLYQEGIIKPSDVLHHREGFGSIVNKRKGYVYVGGLFVYINHKLNFAYDLYPSKISLDRDRKVPKDFDVKYSIGKIQETYEQFDVVGKSADAEFADIPSTLLSTYRPKIRNNQITFVVDVEKDGKKEVHEVSDRYKQQLMGTNAFSQIIFKLKKYLTSAMGLDELAIAFRRKHCIGENANKDFTILMLRLGIELPPNKDYPF